MSGGPPGRSLLTLDGVRLSAQYTAQRGTEHTTQHAVQRGTEHTTQHAVQRGTERTIPAGCRAAGGGQDPDGLAFVLSHGFTGSWRRPSVQAVVATLARHGGVIAFDFRGHGGSGGLSSVGDLEIRDLQAAVGWARLLGYRRVVSIGWSMGAAVAIRHAALLGGVDAVVAVSGPSRWRYQGTKPMRLVHRAIGTRTGRAVAAWMFRTRIAASGWDPAPEPPDALAGRIAPTPLLIVHGDADPYFPLEHALWLARAAREPAELWIVPGFGHAEGAATPALVSRIAAWSEQASGTGPGAASVRIPA